MILGHANLKERKKLFSQGKRRTQARLPIYSQPISVDKDARRANAQHDVHIFRVLSMMEAHPVHRQLLGILEIMQLSFSGRLALRRVG